MKVAIFGVGYVGLVAGACLAQIGHEVICIDNNHEKITALSQGVVSIYEPNLVDLVRDNMASGLLLFTTDVEKAITFADIIFIAVGTPSREDGSVDLSYVSAVAKTIGEKLDKEALIVNKSTVPVGTADQVRMLIQEELNRRQVNINFDVLSNPEFLKEGSAVSDFMKPDRIILGVDSPISEAKMRELYAPFNRNHERIITMDTRSAELTKYAANAMLATKISFINEIANIAERVGADIEKVRQGIGSDRRIGYDFLYAGCGYGGSCLPKDMRSLIAFAKDLNYQPSLLEAVEYINNKQKNLLFEKIQRHFQGDLVDKVIAVWGLAFKPNTDDMREAPSLNLLQALWKAGAKVRAYDPKAMPIAKALYGQQLSLELVDSKEQALQGSDALVIVTEWKSFWSPDLKLIKSFLKQPVIFDGRNIYNSITLKGIGCRYYGIGRN